MSLYYTAANFRKKKVMISIIYKIKKNTKTKELYLLVGTEHAVFHLLDNDDGISKYE